MDLSLAADPIVSAAQPARGRRPEFTGDPLTERLFGITLALTAELAVTRERLDTLERVLLRRAVVDGAEIERFEPTAAEAAARGQWHEEYLARVFRVLLQDEAALRAGSDESVSVAHSQQIDSDTVAAGHG